MVSLQYERIKYAIWYKRNSYSWKWALIILTFATAIVLKLTIRAHWYERGEEWWQMDHCQSPDTSIEIQNDCLSNYGVVALFHKPNDNTGALKKKKLFSVHTGIGFCNYREWNDFILTGIIAAKRNEWRFKSYRLISTQMNSKEETVAASCCLFMIKVQVLINFCS